MINPLTMMKNSQIDGFIQVTDKEAMDCTRRLAKEEGIFGGFSAGANIAAALQILKGNYLSQDTTHTIAVVVCDSGLKYLSTDLWPDN